MDREPRGDTSGPQGFEETLVLECLRPDMAEDVEFVEMFLDEVRIAARLTHPHIAQIFDLPSMRYALLDFSATCYAETAIPSLLSCRAARSWRCRPSP